jgi:hypothetical protein
MHFESNIKLRFFKTAHQKYLFLIITLRSTISRCDAVEPWKLGFQDAASPMMQGIMD